MRNVTPLLSIALCATLVLLYIFLTTRHSSPVESHITPTASTNVADIGWYPPSATWITDLDEVIGGTGTHGFRFDGSIPPTSGQYSYCNMAHVRPSDYVVPSQKEFELIYVELVHRHHKRTPYAQNGFPRESEAWNCSDEALFFSGRPMDPSSKLSANTYWTIYNSQSNPFSAMGLHGSCKFPQITREGLEDSWKHGQDLAAVYRDMLGFLPNQYGNNVSFAVTNNIITSQIASMVISGMFPDTENQAIMLHVQPEKVDSLEPQYPCLPAEQLSTTSIVGKSPTWQSHLEAAKKSFIALDTISGVPSSDIDFHVSFDHYFDNLSSRQCHGRPLPCSTNSGSSCILQSLADRVYRLGQWEYSWQHRGAPQSLAAAVGSYGVWFAELAQHLRDASDGTTSPKYRHNVAHDGSISRILSILQADVMVWPGMGAEVVFELYRSKMNKDKYVVRILWSGSVLRSSNPSLGLINLIDLDILLGYIDGLIGIGADKVHQFCTK